MKLNTDASIRSGRGTGVAGLLRDFSGQVMWCFAERCPLDLDVDMAEATTVFRGLQIAKEQGVEDVLVESDSQILILAITKSRLDLSYFGRLVRRIVVLSKSFNSASFFWIRRTGNMAAHGLASFAFSCSEDFFDFNVLETLVLVVLADRLAI
ncbi:hypothetical protein ACS0TY_011841 [Phlomoides rotata]